MMEEPEVEATLGTGRLLGLFFGMVVVCAIFFGLGYSLGKNSAAPATPAAAEASAPSPAAPPAGEKPSPAVPSETQAAEETPPAQNELTFYRSVEQKEADTKLAPPAPEAPQPKSKAPEGSRPASGYVVQVAAVSKQEDAEALVGALRKKSYPVFIASTSGDNFFRVQVGPFADQAEAKAMKEKLAADGYNAILKK